MHDAWEEARILAQKINSWDKRDIEDLRDMIKRLGSIENENGDPIDARWMIDMANLPSAPIPSDIDTSYPVWSVDEKGRALVGDAADQIETIDRIRAGMD